MTTCTILGWTELTADRRGYLRRSRCPSCGAMGTPRGVMRWHP